MHPTQHQARTTRTTTATRPRRRRNVVETDEFAAFVRRIITAYTRRVAAGDIEALTDLADLSTVADMAIRGAVSGLREHGYSWADIAARLGITKQTAWERFGSGLR